MGFWVLGLGFGVSRLEVVDWGLGFKVWVQVSGVWGLESGVWGVPG